MLETTGQSVNCHYFQFYRKFFFFFSGMRTLQCDDLQSQHILPQNGRSIANPEADRFGDGINNLLDQTISFCIC